MSWDSRRERFVCWFEGKEGGPHSQCTMTFGVYDVAPTTHGRSALLLPVRTRKCGPLTHDMTHSCSVCVLSSLTVALSLLLPLVLPFTHTPSLTHIHTIPVSPCAEAVMHSLVVPPVIDKTTLSPATDKVLLLQDCIDFLYGSDKMPACIQVSLKKTWVGDKRPRCNCRLYHAPHSTLTSSAPTQDTEDGTEHTAKFLLMDYFQRDTQSAQQPRTRFLLDTRHVVVVNLHVIGGLDGMQATCQATCSVCHSLAQTVRASVVGVRYIHRKCCVRAHSNLLETLSDFRRR